MTRAPRQLSPDEREDITWHISTASADGGGRCVDVGQLNDSSGRVAVHHSQDPDGPLVAYTREEWKAFVAGVKQGEFDFG